MPKKKEQTYNITVVGAGYVGMSLSVLLSQKHKVTVLDIDEDRVNKINNKESTIEDKEINIFLSTKKLDLSATNAPEKAFKNADYVVVATPTDYDNKNNNFDTNSVDSVVDEALKANNKCLIVIKSTIPVGHTRFLQEKYNTERIVFSPEFLRESKSLNDNLFPSRIIVGGNCKASKVFANILKDCAHKPEVETILVKSSEAESIKLFANSYLAMRVSFFNELDSFALANNLDAKSIIDGVCHDSRINAGYNNPSFGYGGYCLPKDTKQLLANYDKIPQTLIQATVSSNSTRKDFITSQILKNNPKTVGFFRLAMKEGSDNFRSSAILGIIKRIKSKNLKVIIYEPSLNTQNYFGSKVLDNIDEFKKLSDIIVANRMSKLLEDVSFKCFSRDIFGEN